MKEDSGILSFDCDRVCYESTTYGSWQLEASAIRLVGEFTNQSGPYLDDHFFVFFCHGEENWYQASYYAEGRESTLQALAKRFLGMSGRGLANSADFESRVLWPPEQANKPLFDFRPMTRGSRWHDRLLDRLFPPFLVESTVRPEFKREPIKPPQHNAGSRPSSGDSPASETPSTPAPRG